MTLKDMYVKRRNKHDIINKRNVKESTKRGVCGTSI
jgi:hypothetical protein